MTDIVLVQMPYGAVERPAIGLGLLHAAAKADGLASEIVYANLEFASEIGVDLYHAIAVSPNEELLGEWTFAAAAFPDFEPEHDRYLDAIRGIFGHYGFRILRLHRESFDLQESLLEVRRKASDFVDRTARYLLEREPRIVGASSTFQQHCASLAVLRRVKELRPEVRTLLGGGNCEGAMGKAARRAFPWLDVVVSGEAEELFPALSRRLLEDVEEKEPLPAGVLGSNVCNGNDTPASRALVQDLDRSPVPDYGGYYDSLGTKAYASYVKPGLLIETSRGCWWGASHHCAFCGLNGFGMTYRAKSPDRVLRELSELSDRHGIRQFEVVDNILSYEYLDSVVPGLSENGRSYDLFYEVKANLKRGELEKLASAGVRWLQPGIESLNDELLKLLDKGTTGLQNVRFLKWSREIGVRLVWLFLYDIPFERDACYGEMAEFLPLLTHYQPPDGLTRVQYHRFSPYFQKPAEFGLTLSPTFAYSYVYPLPAEELSELAYFFDDYENPKRQRLAPESADPERPGLAALFSAVESWRGLWIGRTPPPVLSMKDEGDELVLTDTRPIATESSFHLRGLAREVYLACDPLRGRAGLMRALPAGTASDAVERALEELKERKILLDVNGRFLSLALREPFEPLPGITPCGHIDLIRYRRDRRGAAPWL